MKALFVSIIMVFATGCANLLNSSRDQKSLRYVIDLEALSDGRQKDKIALVQAIGDSSQLEKNYYEKYLIAALQSSGYTIVTEAKDASLLILVSYGIGEEKLLKSKPIIGYMPGQTTTYTGNTTYSGSNGYYGSANSYGSSYSSGSFYRAGTQYYTEKSYKRAVKVDAYLASEIRGKKPEQLREVSPIWLVNIVSEGPTDDMRAAFPRLLTAAKNYFNSDSKGKVKGISVKKIDETMEAIFNGEPIPNKEIRDPAHEH